MQQNSNLYDKLEQQTFVCQRNKSVNKLNTSIKTLSDEILESRDARHLLVSLTLVLWGKFV